MRLDSVDATYLRCSETWELAIGVFLNVRESSDPRLDDSLDFLLVIELGTREQWMFQPTALPKIAGPARFEIVPCTTRG